ncbi:apolipoprotein D [Drosophila rhopaloa]|uniref:Apolipoprotein D n=2 Tax=Drosophila rhopaloa TaxID=1041015 RepID=A0ABM5JBF4_DRORH|nr:apolipoprotein D [Drosophila rhopaloa]
MNKWKFFAFVVLELQFSLAMRAFHGPCPDNMTAVGDLDMNRFEGKWYTHSIYPPLSLRVPKCQSTEFVEDAADKYHVTARELNSQTGTIKVRNAEIIKIEENMGRYILGTRNTAFPEGVQIYVLDTDYVNFAIRFMCFDASNIFSFHWAVIQTRKRLPPSEIVYMAQHFGQKAGLVISDMSKVPQESCPADT